MYPKAHPIMTESTRNTLGIIITPVDTAPSVPRNQVFPINFVKSQRFLNDLGYGLEPAHFPLVLNLL